MQGIFETDETFDLDSNRVNYYWYSVESGYHCPSPSNVTSTGTRVDCCVQLVSLHRHSAETQQNGTCCKDAKKIIPAASNFNRDVIKTGFKVAVTHYSSPVHHSLVQQTPC